MLDRRLNIDPVRWSERWLDPWRVHWAQRLRDALRPAAAAFASLLGIDRGLVGIVPAVYFTRLRMGSVPFLSWSHGSADVELAFPWNPRAELPPFTCFAPRIEREDESRFTLITRVGSIVDGYLVGERRSLRRSAHGELPGVSSDAFSWSDEEPNVTIADEWILREAGVRRTTTTYLLPPLARRREPWVPYVPLLYFQAAARYDTAEAEAILRAATATITKRDRRARKYLGFDAELAAIRRAVLASAQAAHVRAREWLNQKTQLLSRAGFEGLKDDLQRRIEQGEEYGQVFFDIDNFKRANDRFQYDGADLLAAALTDRATAFMQAQVTSSYRQYADARLERTELITRGPDSFRALLAHVSGDEFRFFIRTASAEPAAGFTEDDALAFAEGLVKAVAKIMQKTRSASVDRTLEARSAAVRNLTRDERRDQRILKSRATISAGLVIPRWRKSMDLTEIRAVLNQSDVAAETATRFAKKAGRNRVVRRRMHVKPRYTVR